MKDEESREGKYETQLGRRIQLIHLWIRETKGCVMVTSFMAKLRSLIVPLETTENHERPSNRRVAWSGSKILSG